MILTKVGVKLLHNFAQKLEAAESQDSIEEVKKQLEKFKISSLPQDTSPSSSSQKI